MKRKILIIDKKTKQVYNGLIKICKECGDKKGIYLFSDLFNGQKCIPSEKEKFGMDDVYYINTTNNTYVYILEIYLVLLQQYNHRNY